MKTFWFEFCHVGDSPYNVSILVVQYGFMLIEGDWEVHVIGIAGQSERFGFDGDEKDARYLLSLLDSARRSGWPVKYNVSERTGQVEVMG